MIQQLHLHTLFQPNHNSGTATSCAHAFSSHWTCAQLLNVNTWRKVNLQLAKKCLSEAVITFDMERNYTWSTATEWTDGERWMACC